MNLQNQKTFRPIKEHQNPHLRKIGNTNVNRFLHKIDTIEFVKIPEGEDINTWILMYIVDFYNQLSILYAPIEEFCTKESCPTMTAGENYTYRWFDGKKYQKPVDLPAREYITLLFDWVDGQINPLLLEKAPFPKHFDLLSKKIVQRLFRIYAHCYYHHMHNMNELGYLPYWNTSFKIFIYFSKEFDMIPQEQLAPLQPIIEKIYKP